MTKARELFELLAGAEELTVVCHNNPDPDCLASTLALGRIAAEAGIDERQILYGGSISHQQNRAFINLLDMELELFTPDSLSERDADSLLAFVDHSLPGVNNELPEGTPVDIVIDHHSVDDIEGRFVDHREDIGATATILTEYVHELDVTVEETLATGLLFAIRRETLGFLRGATTAEYDAAGALHNHVNRDLLRTLSTPSVSGATIDAISDSIDNRIVRGSVLLSHVGRTDERDALPQAADYLATLEGVETAVVFGIVEDAIELSARTTDSRVHIGNALKEAFGDVGSAGGHREMGGGEIPLGIFAGYRTDDERFVDIVENVVVDRLSDSLKLSPSGD